MPKCRLTGLKEVSSLQGKMHSTSRSTGFFFDFPQDLHALSGGRGKVVWFPTFDADNHLKTFNHFVHRLPFLHAFSINP
jgi:hypothetical protein